MELSINITDQINKRYKEYALYVLQSRGIPNFYDSLTPVQRIVLLNSPSHFGKTIGVVGEVIRTGLYHHGDCIDYDTEINLGDGTQIKIGEWFDNNPDSELIVKCFDEKTQEETISIGHSPRIGQVTDEMIIIELENGEVFKCTSNHPFLTKNRGWINASELLDSDEIVNL
jgi:intein/homing endonuclease